MSDHGGHSIIDWKRCTNPIYTGTPDVRLSPRQEREALRLAGGGREPAPRRERPLALTPRRRR